MRRESTKRRDADAAQLRIRGWNYQAIADELGYAGPSGAHAAVSRSLAESVRAPLNDARQLAAAHLDELAREAWKVIRGRWIAVSGGKAVVLDDEPIPDHKPIVEALRVLVAIEDRRARLLGLDAPTQTRVNVITEDLIDAELARLDAQLAQRDAS